MKRKLIPLLLIFCFLTGCRPHYKHADTFYDINGVMDRKRIPLVKPIYTILLSEPDNWYIFLQPWIYICYPDSQEPEYIYSHIYDLRKIAISDGVIMIYSPFIDEEADSNIQNNYFHWFVLIPGQEISKGFHTEDEFTEYIKTLSIDDPDWQNPDEVYKRYSWTGCLEWIPDCEK